MVQRQHLLGVFFLQLFFFPVDACFILSVYFILLLLLLLLLLLVAFFFK